MSRILVFLSLLISLCASRTEAVTCDFNYKLTPQPHAVGLRILDTESGPVMLWYPATTKEYVQLTDERDPSRMNLRDYLIAARFGVNFRAADLRERSKYLRSRYQQWFDKGAREIQVAHMLAAVMHAHVDAPSLPAKGVVIGTIDPLTGERMAGHGLIAIGLQSSFLFQDASQRQAIAATLKTQLPNWLGQQELAHKRVLLIQEPMALGELADLAQSVDAAAVIINHHLKPDDKTTALKLPILAFQTDDRTEEDQTALAQIVGASIDVTEIPALETQLLSLAGYEACARMAFSKQIYQGWHLHHRRTLVLADMLTFMNKRLKFDLELKGTNARDPAMDAEIGVTRRTKL